MTLDNNLLKKIENFKRHILKSIPLPSTNTPSTDNTNGSTGSSLEYARSDHQHPKSTLYAESVHSHNDILSDLLDDINNTTIVVDSPNPIGQDDTILLRGRMYGDDVSGKSIDYYIGNTLIGSSVTNGNGVSFLDYECDGLGVRNVTAKKGSIVSETYEVYDYINFDNGLDGDCSNIWTGNTEDLTRQSDGSLFSSTSARKLLSSALISGDFEATFEAIGTGSPLWGVQDSSSNMTRFYIANSEDFRYYKITRSNGTITAKTSTDGTSWTNLTAQSSNVTSADCYFLLHNNSGTKSIKFKNVKIYPI